jgi:hypothetical protein
MTEHEARQLRVGDPVEFILTGRSGIVTGIDGQCFRVRWVNGREGGFAFQQAEFIRRSGE